MRFFLHSSLMQTLKRQLEMRGVGLHSGREIVARLLPRDQVGIAFRRVDLPHAPEVEADWRAVSQTVHATTLKGGEAEVSTPEHLLAALWMSGVTSCVVELDGPEVPILDGSSAPWCELLNGQIATSSTRCPQIPILGLRHAVYFESGNASVLALPHHELRVSVAVEFGRDYLEAQLFDAVIDDEVFQRELAPARTFALEEWIAPLRAQGLIRGASLDSAILLGTDAPSSPLRFSTELARHKALDLLGDLALLFAPRGAFFHAHLVAIRAGHAAHLGWMQKCVAENALVEVAI